MSQKLTRATCTPDQLACWEVLSMVFGGDHHLFDTIEDIGRNGIKMKSFTGTMATYDSNTLTRLVFACHDACIRLELRQGGHHYIVLALHKRHTRKGDECHPTIEQALATWRERHPAEEQA